MTDSARMTKVTIYCDGSYDQHTGAGGWGAVLSFATSVKEAAGYASAERPTTLELIAMIEALKLLRCPCRVRMFVDNQPHASIAEGRATPLKDLDLWERFFYLARKHELTVCWIPGHHGDRGNERAHILANAAMRRHRHRQKRRERRQPDVTD